MSRQLSFLVCSAVVALAAAASPLRATSFVMVADEALADQAAVVVEARLLGAAEGAAATTYSFAVERVMKGEPVGDQVMVRVLGGSRPDGPSLRIWGVPSFREDERSLLFLRPREDGTYRILHVALGAFHVVEAGERPVALRDFTATHQLKVVPQGFVTETAAPDRPRDLERFARWLEDRSAGRQRAADYFVELRPPEMRQVTEAFTLLQFRGVRMRWFEFESGGSTPFRAMSNGQEGVTGGGFSHFQTALAAWNADPATTISYAYGGTIGTGTGFLCSDPPTAAEPCSDGFNTIHFNDPNDELDDFSCESGGVLALGGPWFDPDRTSVYKGQSYYRILEADIITNAGLACFFDESPNASRAAEELFAHELGHTLGLGHSCDELASTTGVPSCLTSATLDNALMRWSAHDDARGAALQADDRAAANALYSPSATAPAAPGGLQAIAVSTTQVNLAWKDNSSNETSLSVEGRTFGGAFAVLGTLPANSTAAAVSPLTPGTVYEFRVRASNASGDSGFSNTAVATTFAPPGACVADGDTLCLNNDRFAVEALWETASASGRAQVVELTPETGYLWFFNAQNVEAVVKVINACAFTVPRFWVFAGGLTDVRTVITVTDSQTGATKTYVNPQGTPFQPVQDTSAFATCP